MMLKEWEAVGRVGGMTGNRTKQKCILHVTKHCSSDYHTIPSYRKERLCHQGTAGKVGQQ